MANHLHLNIMKMASFSFAFSTLFLLLFFFTETQWHSTEVSRKRDGVVSLEKVPSCCVRMERPFIHEVFR